MGSTQKEIEELEEELRTTKYNKATQHHIAKVKAKIAKLKREEEQRKAGTGAVSAGYQVKKTGDATVVLVGYPSVGKSTLLNSLTGADSETADYEFTTLNVIPGMLDYKSAKIQILDVPGIVEGAASGRGRGKEVLACAMSADLVMILVDIYNYTEIDKIKKELRDAHLRLNRREPDVKIKKTIKGGIDLGATVELTKINEEDVKSILKEFGIINAQVVIRTDIGPDELIDVIEGNKKYVPGIVVLNKADLANNIEDIKDKLEPDLVISAKNNKNLNDLKEMIFEKLDLIRIYCKDPGEDADMDEPLILKKGANLEDMCNKLHKDFSDRFKYARIWGSSKFAGQKMRTMDHVLHDEDIVELNLD